MKLLLCAVLLSGCFIDIQPRAEFCAEAAAPAPSMTAGLTWHRDVAPIFANRCTRCHTGEGPGTVVLSTYADVVAVKNRVRTKVETREMPPAPAAHCCREVTPSRALTDAELATVLGWIEQGAVEGVAPAISPAPVRMGLDRVDVEIPMPTPYQPKPLPGRTDDTRCFLLPWTAKETRFVTGIDVRPGRRAQNHHSLVLVVSPEDAKGYADTDAKSPEPGWPCPGGIVTKFRASLGGSFLEASESPKGHGVEVRPGDSLLLQMHYAPPPTGTFEPDLTRVQLRTQTEKVEPLLLLATFNLAWLSSFKVQAGEHEVAYSYADDPTVLFGGKSLLLRTVQLHMHEWGKRGQISVLRANGTRECVLQIDRWKHDYLADYELAVPVRVDRGDRLLIECQFDNSISHQPRVNGSFAEPKELRWNEEEEMCAGFYGATIAPGQ